MHGFASTEKLSAGADDRPAWSRTARVALSLAAAIFSYGAIDEQANSGRVWLVAFSIVGLVAVCSEVRRRRVHGERWSKRALVALAAPSVAFLVGSVQAALFHLQ